MRSIIFLGLFALVVNGQDSIVLQKDGRIADFTPYHALVRSEPLIFFNAGTIISTKHVLTTGHLYYLEQVGSKFFVGVGSNRIDQLIYYAVEKFYIHPNYRHVDKRWAFGIFLLNHTLTFNSFVQPIALPPLDAYGPLWQEQGLITSHAQDTGILKAAYQRISNVTSTMSEDTIFFGEYDVFGGSINEQCFRIEAGAGLIVRHFGVDTIMGLAILGEGCGSAPLTYYARVTKARTWINEIIKPIN